MVGHIKRHAVSYVALVLALSTSAYAAVNIPKNSITGKHVKESSLGVVPKAKAAGKLTSRVNKVFKLDVPGGNPVTTNVGPFSIVSDCYEASNQPEVLVRLTAANEFDLGGEGVGQIFSGGATDAVIVQLNHTNPQAAGFPFWASTRVENEVHSISGFVHVSVNLHGEDCVVTLDVMRTAG